MATILREYYGFFNGYEMREEGGDKSYAVPPNYASKSRLVEGDYLRMMITAEDGILFKQVRLRERRSFIGTIVEDEVFDGLMVKESDDGARYFILDATVTYFGLEVGDEVVAKVPIGLDAEWAAIEEIISKASGQ